MPTPNKMSFLIRVGASILVTCAVCQFFSGSGNRVDGSVDRHFPVREVCAAPVMPLLLRLAAKPRDEAIPAPKFNVVTIDEAPGMLDRLGIVGAHDRLEPYETLIKPDGISPVLCQPQSPPQKCSRTIAFIDLSRCLSGTGLGHLRPAKNLGAVPQCWSARLFGLDPNDVDNLLEFVGDFQPPVLSGRERGCRGREGPLPPFASPREKRLACLEIPRLRSRRLSAHGRC
jgi:hypothetical protein